MWQALQKPGIWHKCQSCKTVKILTVIKFAAFLNFSLTVIVLLYHYAKFQSLKSLYHIKCTIERKFLLFKCFISPQLIWKLAIHKAWDVWESRVSNSKVFRVFWLLERLVTVQVILTTIAKFSGFLVTRKVGYYK